MNRVPAALALLLLHQEADARGDDVLRIGTATLRKWVQRGHITRGDGGYDLTEILTYLEQRERSTSVDDLITWLRAQLDDDERTARKNTGADGLGDDGSYPDYRTYDGKDIDAADEFLHRFTSHRVLREVEAKREIIEQHPAGRDHPEGAEYCTECGPYWLDGRTFGYPCATIRLLAVPFSDRPGYLEEWRPE